MQSTHAPRQRTQRTRHYKVDKHGHLQTIHTQAHILTDDERLQRMRTWTDTCRNFISQKHAVTAMYRGSFPQTLLPPLKRKEAVRRLFPFFFFCFSPKTCAVQLRPSWCFTYRQPDTWPCVGVGGQRPRATCHAQTVACRRPQALRRGTLYRKTVTSTHVGFISQKHYIPQPKLPLAQCSPQNLEGTPRWKDTTCTSPVHLSTPLRALRWNVTTPSSWQKPLLPTSNTQWNSSTSYLLVRCCFWRYFVLRNYPERLHVDTCNSLLDRRSLLAFCQVRARCSGRSLGRAGSPLTFCENKRKTGKSDKVKGQEEKALTLPNSELPKPRLLVSTRTQQASFENRHVDFNRSHEELKSQAQTFAVRDLLENWTQTELCLASERMSEKERLTVSTQALA